MSEVSVDPWFIEWFDSPYYHILYDHRDHREAEFFMKNLVAYLQLKKGEKILDLPCGKGRHALYLNKLGYDVIGADLSENSIRYAKQFENEQLKFEQHDMREPFTTKFKAIFNLFTSFGYFDSQQENIAVLKNLKNGLEPNGYLVIDFMNVNYVQKHLVQRETIVKKGIHFNISRTLNNDFILKRISFNIGEKAFNYTEKVAFLPYNRLKQMVKAANLSIKNCFGDYDLSPFNENDSQRLILILS
ncbi:class I SAM-dependent methyltransferase [Flavobacteriaceae bacterium F08102]|nr:class I SAM-dependent methyltransferase [Flavobacteriaceae bacterium F08102]